MKVFLASDVAQVSPEWWSVRRGVPTASDFDKIITAAKAELSASADGYVAQLVGDIADQRPDYFTSRGAPVNSYAIRNGVAMEPQARRWYALESAFDITEVGFVLTDDLRFGCSPDGLINLRMNAEPDGEWQGFPYYHGEAEGVLELKVPLPGTQAMYLMRGEKNVTGSLLREYLQQVHGELHVTGCQWAEIVSYSNNQLAPLRVRVTPDDYTAKLAQALETFHRQLEEAKAKFLPQGAVA